MASRDPAAGDGGSGRTGHLATILPIDRDAVESLSWALGTRVTTDASLVLVAHNRATESTLAVFDATDYTCIVRFRTPVGRETFFGVAAADLRPMLERLLDRDDWTVRQGSLDGI